ncbi:probable WRKY transcription factor 41 [Diospyros lotus]|uniref:probable WRKY transcription factor 41 n=1 Tax=Diospyros lotus TaxID=55363 RepID=UPI00224D93FF|nr:probable WRKY transcription factor 41 [Diospyros lotus]
MEGCSSWEQRTLINELTQGMELAKQLRFHVDSPSSTESQKFLLQRIMGSYEKALMILNWNGSVGQQPQRQPSDPAAGLAESSLSGEGSPPSHHQDQSGVSKKRKVTPIRIQQVRVSSENGTEGAIDDGYSWRKYGQKDILGAKHPRSYYRCTYKNTQNCWATKQVQRSDDDCTIFEITYKGEHTCKQIPSTGTGTALAPASIEKQEELEGSDYPNIHLPQPYGDMLLNYRASLTVNTEEIDSKAMTSPFTFPSTSFGWMERETQIFPSLVSPAGSETNYFSAPPSQKNSSFGVRHNFQHSESDLTEMISTNNTPTNSPLVDLDFPIDPADLDTNFPFDTPGFFT